MVRFSLRNIDASIIIFYWCVSGVLVTCGIYKLDGIGMVFVLFLKFR